MDNTFLIQVTNQKALRLLHELEELDLIKVLKEDSLTQKQIYLINTKALLARNKDKA